MPTELRLLVKTRHSPLPENDGAGACLHDMLSYLVRRGVRIEVAWFQPPGGWIRRGWCRVPANVHRVCSLHTPGAFALGQWRFFWFGALRARQVIAAHLSPEACYGPLLQSMAGRYERRLAN